MTRTCAQCGKAFEAKRSTAKFCSTSCRANHSKGMSPVVALEVPGVRMPTSSPLIEALRAELDAAGVLETSEAELALLMAGIAEDPTQSAAGRVAAGKESRAAKEAALASARRLDSMDEVTRKRDEKLRLARGS